MHVPKPLPVGAALAIAAALLLLLAAFGWAAGWIGARRIDGGDVLAALEYNGGVHEGYRRAHAKGLCFRGTFIATGEGAALSRAFALRKGVYPVAGRFSLAGGNPLASDGRNVFRSMALVLRAENGDEWRMAMDHTPIFPVRDVASFVALQRASKPDPTTGKPNPAVMKAFLAAHPEVKAFQDFMARDILPDSFANSTYYSINAFRFHDARGHETMVRWQFEPDDALAGLDKAALPQMPRDFLFREMIERLNNGPATWQMKLVVANPGDVTDDATAAWKGPHQVVSGGTLQIDEIASEADGGCRDLNFDPAILPDGIGLSDDPLLAARSKAYSSSFIRRAGEEPGRGAFDAHLGPRSEP